MGEPAHVGLEHRAQVRNAVLEHGQPVDAHAEGEALPFVRVEAAIAQHVRMDHAAAENFHPVVAGVQLQLAAGAVAADVHLGRRLGEREVVRPETRVDALDLEEPGDEGLQRPLQVAHVDVAVDHQPLDLMEHRGVGGVRILPEGAARGDDADRRRLTGGDPRGRGGGPRLQGADLHRAGVGAQHLALAVGVGAQEEGVVQFARGVLGREVQGGEIVPVVLDVRPLGDREAHLGEDRDQLVHHLHGRVHPALAPRARRQGQVDMLGRQPGLQLGGLQLGLARPQGGGDAVAQAIQQRAALAPLLRAQRAHPLEQAGDGPGLAEGLHAQRLDGGDRVGRADGVDQVEFEFGEIGHGPVRLAGRRRSVTSAPMKTPAPGGRSGRRLIVPGAPDQARAARTLSATALKPASSAAMAASTLRSKSISATRRPCMNWL